MPVVDDERPFCAVEKALVAAEQGGLVAQAHAALPKPPSSWSTAWIPKAIRWTMSTGKKVTWSPYSDYRRYHVSVKMGIPR